MTSGLPHGYRQIGEDRIRESVGLAYPELAPGLTIEHRPGRTVTEVDSLLGAALSGNVAPSTPMPTTAARPSGAASWSAPASPSTSWPV